MRSLLGYSGSTFREAVEELSNGWDMARQIAVGDTLPDGVLYHIDDKGLLHVLSIRSLFANKRAVLLGVPGAFTPTCSLEHIPDYIAKAPLLKAKGVNRIYCITVNDAYVVKEWASRYNNNEHLRFLADGSATYTKALGVAMDLTPQGGGFRGRRFVLFVDNLIVRIAIIENDGDTAALSIEDLLQKFI